MARYVDGFVLPVPKRNLDAYRRMARKAGKIWSEHGALEYREWSPTTSSRERSPRSPRASSSSEARRQPELLPGEGLEPRDQRGVRVALHRRRISASGFASPAIGSTWARSKT